MNTSAKGTRTLVEDIPIGSMVRAVRCGPVGRVVDHNGMWVLVEYHKNHSGGTMAYNYGRTLYVEGRA